MLVKQKTLIFENGRSFTGYSFGSEREAVGEVVFCTSMVGYQEILTNPANKGKIMVFTYPIIGSYGLSDEDYESSSITVSALIVREYNDFPSNFRYTKTLAEQLQENNVPGLYGIDTRELTQMLRSEGIMRAVLKDSSQDEINLDELFSDMTDVTLAQVSSKKVWYSRTSNYRYNLVAIDCGITNSIIKTLNAYGCNVIVVPYNSSKHEILSLRPDGVIISDGPGYPSDADIPTEIISELSRENIPILGIGFGLLAVAVAFGAKLDDTKLIHFGSNHPVVDIDGRIEIVTQNHSLTTDISSLADDIVVTHRNLMDNSIEGISVKGKHISAVSFYPASIDEKGRSYIYNDFLAAIDNSVRKDS
ncbi:MAG: carbamoyl phosphate synthase small subunit [Oscillospiraceae bacterium]|nr:carbamoyl phosphate synthase small subunit [Oscillospiraceae bacterium]